MRGRLARVFTDRDGWCDDALAFAADWPSLRRLTRQRAPEVVVVDPYDPDGMFEQAACTRFVAEFSSPALLVYGALSLAHMGDVLTLARIGAHGVVVRNVDDEPHQLLAVLERAASSRVLDPVMATLPAHVDERLRDLIRYVVSEVAGATLTAEMLARRYGAHEKTLREHMKRAGLLPPDHLIRWARLLHVARLLADRQRTLENVAAVLGYPSASAVSHEMRRYVQMSPREVRASGCVAELLHLCLRRTSGTAPKGERR